MATKINIGGELDPRTVEGIVADAGTIIDRTANKRQDEINADVVESLEGKQDVISDLATIRSGASAGASAVQPLDIADVAYLHPSGSIAPLVDPSDYATTEDLSQLRSKVDVLDIADKEALTPTLHDGRIKTDGTIAATTAAVYSDPIPVEAGDVIILNAFVAAVGSPISYTDSAASYYEPMIGAGVGTAEYVALCYKSGYVAVSYTKGTVSLYKSSIGALVSLLRQVGTISTALASDEATIASNKSGIDGLLEALDKGSSTPITTTFSSGSVKKDGTFQSNGNHFASIPVSKGDIIIFYAFVASTASPISLTDASQTYYTPVVGAGVGTSTYTYLVLEDGYITLSYMTSGVNVTHSKTTLGTLMSILNKLAEIDGKVDSLINDGENWTEQFPECVFGIESGSFAGREYATAIYPEALTFTHTGPDQGTYPDTSYRKQDKVRINGGIRQLLQKPKQNSNSYNNFRTAVETIAKSVKVKGNGLNTKTLNFNYVRANRYNAKNKKAFVLVLGASIVQQGGISGYLQMLGDMDNTDIGGLDVKVLGSNVGSVTPSITYDYAGETKTITTHTEGRAGWPFYSICNWPFEARADGVLDTLGKEGMWYAAGLSTKTPYDSSTAGQSPEVWTGTAAQHNALISAVFGRYKPDYCQQLWTALHNFHTQYRCGMHTIWYYSTGAEYVSGASVPIYNPSTSDAIMEEFFTDLCNNPDNVFFDLAKARAYTGSYVWTNKTAFSISKWVERYRTLDDNGNQLTLGQGTGTFVTSANINNPVCNPTHIMVVMSTNDKSGMLVDAWECYSGTESAIKALVFDALDDLHTNTPSAKLGWGCPRQAGVFYPTEWMDFGISEEITYFTIHNDWINKLIMGDMPSLGTSNPYNYVPIYFTASPLSGQAPHYVEDFDKMGRPLIVTGPDLRHQGKEWEMSVAYQILAWMYWCLQ